MQGIRQLPVGLVAVVILVVGAGCLGAGAPTGQPTTTQETTTTAATTTTDDGFGPDGFTADPTPLEGVEEPTVKSRMMDSFSSASTYRVTGTVQRTLEVPTGSVNADVSTNTSVDRTAKAIATSEHTTGHMRNVLTQSIVRNGTLYRYVDSLQDDRNGTWTSRSVTPSERRSLDPLFRQQRLLENASIAVSNTTETRNVSAYVVYASVDTDAYMTMYNRTLEDEPLNVTELTYRYVVEKETGRVLEIDGVMKSHTGRGENAVYFAEEYDLSVTAYGEPATIPQPPNGTTGTTVAG
jgi:hypothetical protein